MEQAPGAIALTADGRRCLVTADGVAALAGRTLVTGAIAAATIDAATWVVVRDAAGHALHQFDERGRPSAAGLALGELGDGIAMVATRRGAPVALIQGARAVELRARAGAIEIVELGAAVRDRRVLLAGRGVFERRGNALVPCSGALSGYRIAQDLASAAVVSGALVLDGAAAVVELDQRGIRHLLVHDARRGELRTRIRIGEAAMVAVAERRGLIVLGRDRHIALLDVRTGRCHHERILDAAIRAVVASEDGDRFVVLDERGRIVELRAGLVEAGAAVVASDDLEPDAGGSDAEAAAGAEPDAKRVAATDPAAAAERAEGAELVATLPAGGIAADTPPLLSLAPLAPRAPMALADQRAALGDLFALVSAWCHTAGCVARGAADGVAAARARERDASEHVAGWDRAAMPLTELADEFGLSSLARAILLVAAAPQLWGELARTYAALAADPARALV